MRSATCVSYYRPPESPGKYGAAGGELTVFHDGRESGARVFFPAHNSAVLLDTDSAFHSVSPCLANEQAVDLAPDPPPMPPDTVLRPADQSEPLGEWQAVCGEEVVYRCGYEALRLSISCKFQCWADEEEQRLYHTGEDALLLPDVIARLRVDLVRRGVLKDAAEASSLDLPELLIETYLLADQFPTREAVRSPPLPMRAT